jgi:hypothetical protein
MAFYGPHGCQFHRASGHAHVFLLVLINFYSTSFPKTILAIYVNLSDVTITELRDKNRSGNCFAVEDRNNGETLDFF